MTPTKNRPQTIRGMLHRKKIGAHRDKIAESVKTCVLIHSEMFS